MGTITHQELISLLPETITHVVKDWSLVPSGKIARVVAEGEVRLYHDGVAVVGMSGRDRETYLYQRGNANTVWPLPDPQDGVILVVSLQVRMSNPGRMDMWNPAGYSRDKKGRIMGFQYFESWGPQT